MSKRTFLRVLLWTCVLFVCVFFSRTMAGIGEVFKNQELVKLVATANTKFGLDLYKEVSTSKKGENLFLSPFSISAALGMTHLGARGNTAAQMSQVLKWEELKDSHHHGFEDYLSVLGKKQDNYELSSANRLFVNKKAKLLKDYLQGTNQHYSAEAVLADFAGNPKGEADNINDWVELKTNKRIKDLITDIDPLTALILVNAIYFKGNWAQQFDPALTSEGKFKIKPGEEVPVTMMHLKKKFNFGYDEDLRCRVLEMPYVEKDLSMFILLPFDVDGLASLEEKLNHENLGNALKRVHNVLVDISLPRFVLKATFELEKILPSLGMEDAFDETKADFSGIDGTRLLYVSQVIHKAFLEVNEEGSEAAAATAVRIMTRSLPIIEPFNADHPFLFLIRDNRADVILFMGRLVQPESTQQAGSGKTEL